MRIIVTGALGQIGSVLVPRLSSLFPEAKMILLDSRNDKDADILNFDFASFLKQGDDVVHLAALTNATESFEKPDLYDRVNREGTQRIASAAASKGARIFFPSTTSIYGAAGRIEPQSPYASSKWQGEEILRDLGRKKNLSFAIGRFGSVFGYSPAMHFHTAVHKFCLQAIRGESLTIWKTALNQARPYLEILDCVGIIEFILQKNIFNQAVYDLFTLNATVQQILDAIQSCISIRLKIELLESLAMNSLEYSLDNTPFSSLGFQFKGELGDSIRKIITKNPCESCS